MKKLITYPICNGANLHYIHESKFKTTSIGVYFHRQLSNDEAAKNALLPEVLKQGCAKHPTFAEISNELANLYGAVLEGDVSKQGEWHTLCMYFDFISPKYLQEKDVGEKALSLMLNLLFEPLVENNGFAEQYVLQEKTNLRDYIESSMNDKRRYASMRCVSEMCAGDAYSVFDHGSVEKVAEITAQRLYEHYKEILKTSTVDIFVVGDTDIENIVGAFKGKFEHIDRSDVKKPATKQFTRGGDVKKIVENMEVNQGKLCMGFRINSKTLEADRYPLTMFNSIFGGGAHSKLFNNVREKLSLAYYASSSIERKKGIMLINSGIEVANYQKAYDEIFVQLEQMKKGEISEHEMDAAKNSIVNQARSIADSASALQEFYLSTIITESNDGIDEYISNISKVSVAHISEVANKIELDTVYFLKGV